MFYQLCILIVSMAVAMADEDDYGGSYSYHRFSGPVSGDIHKVRVPSSHYHNAHSFDYVAKPDYHYVYGVEDPHTGNSHSHQESRDGDAVTGQYSIQEPDGSLRIVKYTADDENGFQVNVEYVRPGDNQE